MLPEHNFVELYTRFCNHRGKAAGAYPDIAS